MIARDQRPAHPEHFCLGFYEAAVVIGIVRERSQPILYIAGRFGLLHRVHEVFSAQRSFPTDGIGRYDIDIFRNRVRLAKHREFRLADLSAGAPLRDLHAGELSAIHLTCSQQNAGYSE